MSQWLKDEYWSKIEQGRLSSELRWIVGAERGIKSERAGCGTAVERRCFLGKLVDPESD